MADTAHEDVAVAGLADLVRAMAKRADPNDPYPFAKSEDEERRCFLIERFAPAAAEHVDARALIALMQPLLDWMRDGTVPPEVGTRLRKL